MRSGYRRCGPGADGRPHPGRSPDKPVCQLRRGATNGRPPQLPV